MQEDINNPTELIDDKNIALDSKCLERAVACLVKIIHLIHHEDIRNQHQVCELLACEQSLPGDSARRVVSGLQTSASLLPFHELFLLVKYLLKLIPSEKRCYNSSFQSYRWKLGWN